VSADGGGVAAGACDWCGDDASISIGTLTDDSGGSLVRFCADCRARLQQPRCGLCGTELRSSRKADGVYFHSETDKSRTSPVCDSCRAATVFEPAPGEEARK
jgi:hypothetical protein